MRNLFIVSIVAYLFGACTSETNDSATDLEPAMKQITFYSLDSLEIHANYYHAGDDLPIIVLCHQARFNKFEYEGTAQKLNQLGFNCLAIDQRSGGPIGTFTNETSQNAKRLNKPTDFLDAEQDIIAAVNYAANNYGDRVILWGSSYSSTLVLHVAIENDNVDAVVSFSPGDYFSPEKGSLVSKLSSFDKPMFVTSSKREATEVANLFVEMEMNENQIQFIPKDDGFHGSRALWATQPGGEEYWKAVTSFLKKL